MLSSCQSCRYSMLPPASLNSIVRPFLFTRVILSIGESLKQYWLEQGIKLCHGAAETKICAFEDKYQVRLPADLKDYFSTVNGFDSLDTSDNNHITFYTLEEVVPLDEPCSSYFIFADYLIGSHVYAIHLSDEISANNSVIVPYDFDNPVKVACTFSEFVHGYFLQDKNVLFPK